VFEAKLGHEDPRRSRAAAPVSSSDLPSPPMRRLSVTGSSRDRGRVEKLVIVPETEHAVTFPPWPAGLAPASVPSRQGIHRYSNGRIARR